MLTDKLIDYLIKDIIEDFKNGEFDKGVLILAENISLILRDPKNNSYSTKKRKEEKDSKIMYYFYFYFY